MRCGGSLGIAPDVPLLVYAGRICEQKRPELMAAVLKSLEAQSIPFHCLVVGDGPLMPLLRKRVAQYGLGKSVTLLGTLPHRKWLEFLAAGDIFFLPSKYEGISVSLYEAMAMKVVPVMSAVGGQPEVVSTECGILIPPGDSEIPAYVDALKRLIDHPDERQAMASAGHRRISERFALEASNARFIDALGRARQLAATAPRLALPAALAVELATLAIEYARLTTTADLPGKVTTLLRWMRTYKAGRVLLRIRWVRVAGKRFLDALATFSK